MSPRGAIPAVPLFGVYPCLTYRDVPRALGWLREAFGLEGEALAPPDARDGETNEQALLRTAGGGTILVESERPDELHGPHAGHGWVYVAVRDADAHYGQATSAGAKALGVPHAFGEQFRGYSTRDLEGNLWTFGTARP